jgi:hypothetical protein
MADNFYRATGVLVLDKVTPVITALFSGYSLNAAYPGNGKAYIAKDDNNDPIWEKVREDLIKLAAQLDLRIPKNDEPSDTFDFTLPDDWNGQVQVQGNVMESEGDSQHVTSAASLGVEPQFYGVYAHRKDGTHQWLADFDSKQQADELARRLAMVNANASVIEPQRTLTDANDAQGWPSMPALIELFAIHFGANENADLLNFIEHHGFVDEADLDALFLLATCLNDGHNLKEIQFEGCWYCSKARLGEFGGYGMFLSREVEMFSESLRGIELGCDVREALTKGDFDAAADVLYGEMCRLLAGVTDDAQRGHLRQRISARLRESVPEATAATH